jgi:hypothetical protein
MINHPNRGKKVTEITRAVVVKLLKVVDVGLVKGKGNPKPGQMCVEAAVCYALGLPHGDNPDCVAPILRNLKIRLNDSAWSSDLARAKGLRRLAVAQLGSAGALDEVEFRKRIVAYAITKSVPRAFRSAASVQKDQKHKDALLAAGLRCEKEGTREAALDARQVGRTAAAAAAAAADAAAAYAAAAAADAAAAAYAAAYAAAAAAAAAYAAAANPANANTYAAAAYAAAAANAANAAAANPANAANAANAAAYAAYAAYAYAAAANAANAAGDAEREWQLERLTHYLEVKL